MDKFEYKVRSEEIKSLIAQGDYAQAAEIADTIDWRRVKSVMMLCTISDLYKINRRYEDARDLLLLAYDRHPAGRAICYSLCELSIKMGEFVEAVEYYKEYVKIAPKDSGRYVLQYKLYEAQEVSLEERIAVLEELKKRDYREKWAYELAYLYHRVGLSTRCVEECDELILWFGDGKYVIKAMELKMLHQPLSEQQLQKYEHRFDASQEPLKEQEETSAGEVPEPAADSAKETVYGDQETVYAQQEPYGQEEPVPETEEDTSAEMQEEPGRDEFEIHVKTVDVSQFNTINLQKELAEGLKEVLGEEELSMAEPVVSGYADPDYDRDSEMLDSLQLEAMEEENPQKEPESSEVFFGETAEMEELQIPQTDNEACESEVSHTRNPFEESLSMEPDGQISLVMPQIRVEDKQITGQLSIEDIMKEWERLKKEAALGRDIREDELEELEAEDSDIREQIEASAPEETLPEEVLQEVYPEEAEEELQEYPEEPEEELQEYPEEPEEELQEYPEEPEEEVPGYPEDPAREPEERPVQAEEKDSAEAAKDVTVKEPEQHAGENAAEKGKLRALTKEEKELFGPFIQNRAAKSSLITVLDRISLAAYTGNVIVSGAEGTDTLALAKNIVRDVQMTDRNFSGKTAKISGDSLNSKDIGQIMEQFKNGALIIRNASAMNEKTVARLYGSLQQESHGMLVVMEDTTRNMNKFLADNQQLEECFNARFDIEALSNDMLAAFGRKYAREMEYSIDELGMLALHTRIEEMQSIDHAVTVGEVREIVDEAIANANRKTPKHFFDVLFGKRYDEEDMIILKEIDFE